MPHYFTNNTTPIKLTAAPIYLVILMGSLRINKFPRKPHNDNAIIPMNQAWKNDAFLFANSYDFKNIHEHVVIDIVI